MIRLVSRPLIAATSFPRHLVPRVTTLRQQRRHVVLKGIPSILSPELLHKLAQMGHGDEIVIADANFPSASVGGDKVVRADGHEVTALMEAILQLMPLDHAVKAPAAIMQKPDGDPPIVAIFQKVLNEKNGSKVEIERVERFAFYERAKSAFAVVASGETRLWANIILKKGVIGK